MSFKPYPKYKESGVEWLGRVPEHWEVNRFKWSVSSCRNGIWGDEAKGDENDIPCVRVADFDRQRLRVELAEPTIRNISTTERQGRVLERGDLLLEKSGGGELNPVGCVVLYDDAASAICSNFIARMRLDLKADSSFCRYLHSAAYAVRLNARSIKQTSGIQNLDQQQYLDERAAFPPLTEQQVVGAFLDQETAKIDALIAEQQRLIELLQEKRQAVISHAVTKGLNPDAPMKDSGIEWLGEVPEHWEVTRFKRIAAVGNGSTPSRERPDYWEGGDYPWLNSAVVNNSPVDPPGQFVTPVALAECHLPRVQPPAVLVGLTGQGRTRGMASLLLYEATVSQHLGVLVPRAGMKAAFLKRVLDMAYPYLRRDSEEAGSTKGAITCEALANFALASPPADEQREISEYLDDQSRLFDALAREALEGISLLQERRSALISAAVTGQIDVRDFAGGSEAA